MKENFTFRFFLFLFLAIFPAILQNIFAQTSETFLTSSSWTVPCGVTSVTVECWGGGGGGGGDNSTNTSQNGAGGGGGGYCTATIVVTPGSSIAYTIGTAGAAGAAGASGGAGGNTTFSTVVGNGGSGGAFNGAGGAGGGGSGGTVTTGATGGNGTTAGSSGAGGLAGNSGSGNGASRSTDGNGNPGTVNTGGGGGGAYHTGAGTNSGGAGGTGKITITYSTSVPPGTYTIGPSGDNYSSIKDALCVINGTTITGPVIFELQSDYVSSVETFPITVGQYSGVSPTNTITFRPATGANGLSITSSNATATIDFNGSDYIIFDGRPGGTGAINSNCLRIAITSTTSKAVRFINDASNNTLTYLLIEGESANPNAIILFSTTTGTTGNDNNTISYSYIRDLSSGGTAAKPQLGIISLGTAAKLNSGNIITGNHFIDTHNSGADCGAVWVYSNNDAWTITNNHCYQSVIYTANNDNYAFINIAGGSNYTVTGNYIGGNASSCGGTALTVSSGTGFIYPIFFQGTITGSCIISNNTIANISYTTSNNVLFPPFPLEFINITGGSANYTLDGNVIGSQAVINSIVFTHNGGGNSAGFIGIDYASTGTITASNNTFGGITLNGSKSGATSYIVYTTSGSGALTFNNNIIGSTSTANSILISSNSTFQAIRATSTADLIFTNNTFQNIDFNASASAFYALNRSGGSISNCTGNTFRNIDLASDANNYIINHTGTTATISSNTFSDIRVSGTGAASGLLCIVANTASAVTANSNTIGSATTNNIRSDGGGVLRGIDKQGTGAFTCNNNIIQQIFYANLAAANNQQIIGISTTGGNFTCQSNSLLNLSNDVALPVATGIFGIYCNASGTHTISKNIVQNLNINTTTATEIYNMAIRVGTGSGLLEKNSVSGLTNLSTSSLAQILGLRISSGSWDVENNWVNISNSSNTNPIVIYGIDNGSASGTEKIFHNTIKITGSPSASAIETAAIVKSAGATCQINNNIFQNLRTGSPHRAISITNITAVTTNYNYLEVDPGQASNIGKWNATDYNFANWQTAASAANDLNGTEALNINGYALTTFIGANAGTDLVTSSEVLQDKDDVVRDVTPWIGMFEAGVVLPIHLLFFNALPEGGIVQLFWSTATETNNDYFTIERSKEGKDFEPVSIVKSHAPGGNSSVRLDYSTNDKKPFKGVSYYRLKQTDFDGKYSYSNIVAVEFKEGIRNLFVYPNPATNKLNIVVGENERSVVKIYDVTGQVVSESTICNPQSSICNIDIASLSKGVYFVSLSDSYEIRYARFVKD